MYSLQAGLHTSNSFILEPDLEGLAETINNNDVSFIYDHRYINVFVVYGTETYL
jgi:hypothetical protein